MDKGRERMLMKLADGKPYRYLAEKIFPEVMRVDYRIEYTRQQPDAAESLRMSRTGERQTLRLNELFAVAGSYPKGSTEYNDVLDLTAACFPTAPKPISMQRPWHSPKGKRPKRGAIWRDSQPCQSHTTTWAYSAYRKENGTRRKYILPWQRQPA